jgi:hypothetical protein
VSQRVIRIALIGDPTASALRNLQIISDLLRNGLARPEQHKWIADALAKITAGGQPELALGLNRDHRWPRDPDRTTMMALDYLLRNCVRPKPKKIAANVAVDWQEESVETVKSIYRRMQLQAKTLLTEFIESECRKPDYNPMVSHQIYTEAVAAARSEILSGKPGPIFKRPEEVIQVEIHYHHLLCYYSFRDGVSTRTS